MLTTSHSILADQKLTSSTTAIVHHNKSTARAAGRWTKEEHHKFIEAVKLYGKNWKKVEEHVGTRSGAQIRSHAQKFFNKLEKEFNINKDSNTNQIDLVMSGAPRKSSESSISTSTSALLEGPDMIKMDDMMSPLTNTLTEKTANPTGQVSVAPSPANKSSLAQEIQSVPSGSPKSAPLMDTQLWRRSSRKMSEDVIVKNPNSMLDIFLSKIRTSNNGVSLPKLSDLVDLGFHAASRPTIPISLNSTFYRPEIGFMMRPMEMTPTFRMNPRKFSEDNVLVTLNKLEQMRKMSLENLSDFELLTKKVKRN